MKKHFAKLLTNPIVAAVITLLYLGLVGPFFMSAKSDIAVVIGLLLGVGVATLVYSTVKKQISK